MDSGRGVAVLLSDGSFIQPQLNFGTTEYRGSGYSTKKDGSIFVQNWEEHYNPNNGKIENLDAELYAIVTGGAGIVRGAARSGYVLAGRAAYRASVGSLKVRVAAMRTLGYTEKQIAIAAHGARRRIGRVFKGLTPKSMRETIRTWNITKYGDPLGPSVSYLRGRGKSWSDIIESATQTGGKDLGF